MLAKGTITLYWVALALIGHFETELASLDMQGINTKLNSITLEIVSPDDLISRA